MKAKALIRKSTTATRKLFTPGKPRVMQTRTPDPTVPSAESEPPRNGRLRSRYQNITDRMRKVMGPDIDDMLEEYWQYSSAHGNSNYRPVVDLVIVELGKQGMSLAQFCSFFDVTRHVMTYTWRKHESFAYAFDRAVEHSQAYWEDVGARAQFTGSSFNAALWTTAMKARFPKDYRERVTLDNRVQGPHGESPADWFTQIIAATSKAGHEALVQTSAIEHDTDG